MDELTIYALGHSNREPDVFLQLLVDAGIRQLVDIRAAPRSRRFPHFDADIVRELVEPLDIVYHLAGHAFGGRRDSRPDSPHTALGEELRGYADHMASEEFARSAARLIRLAERRGPLACMCSEKLPEHCHRRLLADYLQLMGVKVVHLIDVGQSQAHTLSPELRPVDGLLVYDRNANAELDLD